MRVVNDRGKQTTHAVNDDRAVISHGIQQKTELSKKQGGKLETKMARSVENGKREAKTDTVHVSPSPAERQRAKYAKQIREQPKREKPNTAKSQTADTCVSESSDKHTAHTYSGTAKSTSGERKIQTGNVVNSSEQKNTAESDNNGMKVGIRREVGIKNEKKAEKSLPRSGENKTVSAFPQKRQLSPTDMQRRQQRFAGRQLKLAPHKKYLVLNNGVVSKDKLLKVKKRELYTKLSERMKNKRLKHITRKITSEKSAVNNTAWKSTATLNKAAAKEINKIKRSLAGVDKARKGAKSAVRKDGVPDLKSAAAVKKGAPLGKITGIVTKPVDMAKRQLLSQRPNTNKIDDTGTESVKLGLQMADYGERGIKNAVNTGKKAVDKTRKLAKRVEHRISKSTTKGLKRTLQKKVVRNPVTKGAGKAAKAAAKKTAKTAGKAAVNAAKKTAQAAYKAAQATVKAVASAVAKLASFIASTMPYSLIVIGAVVLILLVVLMFGSIFSGMGGSVGGSGAWLVDDETVQTPEEIYEGYKKFVDQAKEVVERQVKDVLKGTVTAYCESDTSIPHKIIEYHDKHNNRLFYPANGADATINELIDQFGYEEYADYMSLLFVLMTREKQQADGGEDGDIYDFDFTKEDFEEFMKTVNENICRWGETFMLKTAVETSGNACPGEGCRIKYIPGCQCGSATDENGVVHHFCKGHPYCEHDHQKMTVNLYTIKDYYDLDYDYIYDFTETEKARYEASKAIIQAMLEYWEATE